MKKILLSTGCFIILLAFSFKQDNTKAFKNLYALEGTWIMKTKQGNIIGEQWVKVNDNYLKNKGFYIKGTDTVVTETVELRKEKNEINYISTVVNQNNNQPVAFRLTSSENNTYLFENLQHDFPKRIVYQFTTDKTIHAWIDAGKDGPAERQDFYYEKVK